MDYIELKIELNPIEPARGIIIHKLAETGFESFTDEDYGLLAYVPDSLYDEISTNEILNEVKTFPAEIKSTKTIIKQQNWNEVWESNFEPIKIDNRCVVKAPFHEIEEQFDYEIVISPKMSFGTGHHETTYLMLSELFEMELSDKFILDMGSGTGILAILASKLGAKQIDAIDIEEWAFENAGENAQLNGVHNIHPILGDAFELKDKQGKYDIVLANINRNILLQDIERYIESMRDEAELLLSGFYEVDSSVLIDTVLKYGFSLKAKKIKNTWCMLHFER